MEMLGDRLGRSGHEPWIDGISALAQSGHRASRHHRRSHLPGPLLPLSRQTKRSRGPGLSLQPRPRGSVGRMRQWLPSSRGSRPSCLSRWLCVWGRAHPAETSCCWLYGLMLGVSRLVRGCVLAACHSAGEASRCVGGLHDGVSSQEYPQKHHDGELLYPLVCHRTGCPLIGSTSILIAPFLSRHIPSGLFVSSVACSGGVR